MRGWACGLCGGPGGGESVLSGRRHRRDCPGELLGHAVPERPATSLRLHVHCGPEPLWRARLRWRRASSRRHRRRALRRRGHLPALLRGMAAPVLDGHRARVPGPASAPCRRHQRGLRDPGTSGLQSRIVGGHGQEPFGSLGPLLGPVRLERIAHVLPRPRPGPPRGKILVRSHCHLWRGLCGRLPGPSIVRVRHRPRAQVYNSSHSAS
mmetsp:Transcript_56891/g.166601  ORF Transcript_56891/g.166601 Transcript_56891/m.166601 type:complete len:209 (+) Transcript_56891:317-943(+)